MKYNLPVLIAVFPLVCCGEAVHEDVNSEDIFQTPSEARWEIVVDELADTQKGVSIFKMDEKASGSPLVLPYRLRPVLDNRSDLIGLLNPEPSLLPLISGEYKILQKVPRVPDDPRYSDPKFKKLKDAFTRACTESASEMGTTIMSLLEADELAFRPLLATAIPQSKDYEKSCLIPLDEVPLAIRQVIGTLTYDRWTFCSATIVGQNQILTSRHCFFVPETGKVRSLWRSLKDEVIVFRTPVRHGRSNAWYVKVNDQVNKVESRFSPSEDHIVLDVVGATLQHHATVSSPLLSADMPVMAWVVGSNALIGDVRDLKDPFQFVRGSLKNTCAVMEVTAQGCLYHTCQTGGSTSGAGVLKLAEDGSVLILGVHKGPISRAVACERNPPTRLILNLAAQYATP